MTVTFWHVLLLVEPTHSNPPIGRPSNRAINVRRGRNFIKQCLQCWLYCLCVEWGRLNAYGIGAFRSDFIALQRFEKACAEGSVRGCARAASLKVKKTKLFGTGIVDLRQACSKKEPLACHLGLLYLEGQGIHSGKKNDGLEKIKKPVDWEG